MKDIASDRTEEISHNPVNPFLFTILILPMGVSVGYVSVTLGYLLSEAGVSVEKIAALVGATMLPHVFKFIWAPLNFYKKIKPKSTNHVHSKNRWRITSPWFMSSRTTAKKFYL